MSSPLDVMRRLFPSSALSDGALIERFVTDRDEAAFTELVHRHGPMILGLCRRILRDTHDAEDAFQAAFLVLARKAADVRTRESVGGWLYRIAYRAAMHARARRRDLPLNATSEAASMSANPLDSLADREIQQVLDEELQALPEKYREPLVLCCLEGQTHKEAALLLKLPLGTLKSRVSRGRELLAARLRRRGIAVTGVAVAGLLAGQASAAVFSSLAKTTAQAALGCGASSAGAAMLAESVLRGLTLARFKLGLAGLAMVLLGFGAALFHQAGTGAEPPIPPAV